MHGGASPGAPRGKANGNYKHGQFTEEAVYMRRTISALVRASRQSLADLSGEHDYSVVREVGTGCGTRQRLVRASN